MKKTDTWFEEYDDDSPAKVRATVPLVPSLPDRDWSFFRPLQSRLLKPQLCRDAVRVAQILRHESGKVAKTEVD